MRTVILEFECGCCGSRQVIEPPPEGEGPINAAMAGIRVWATVDGRHGQLSMDLCDRCYVVVVRALLLVKRQFQETPTSPDASVPG